MCWLSTFFFFSHRCQSNCIFPLAFYIYTFVCVLLLFDLASPSQLLTAYEHCRIHHQLTMKKGPMRKRETRRRATAAVMRQESSCRVVNDVSPTAAAVVTPRNPWTTDWRVNGHSTKGRSIHCERDHDSIHHTHTLTHARNIKIYVQLVVGDGMYSAAVVVLACRLRRRCDDVRHNKRNCKTAELS